MKKKQTIYIIRTTLVLLCIFLICPIGMPAKAAKIIRTIPVTLDSNWTICQHFQTKTKTCEPSRLPQSWNVLHDQVKWVSFDKQLIIHQSLRHQVLAIFIEHIDESDEVWFNGRQIGKTGHLPPNFETGYRKSRTYLIPSELVRFNQYNQLSIKAFSSRNLTSIHYQAPIIGDFFELQHKHQEMDYLYFGIIISLIILMLFQVFYLVIVRPNNEIIFLLIYFFCMASISFLRSQIPLHMNLSSNLDLKLESFLYAFAIIGLSVFMYKFFELPIMRITQFGLFILGLSGVASLIWFDPLVSRLSMEINQLIVVSTSFGVFISVFIAAYSKERVYSVLLGSSVMIYWLVLLLDVTMDSGFFGFSQVLFIPSALPLAASLLSVLLALTVTHKYWQFFKGATYDHLTGTMLRPAFFQRLSEEMQRTERFNENLLIAVIDIRQVRKLTANYGQSTANQILSVVSNALTKVLRPFDLLCRFNDDEFCIAATVGSTEDAESCLDRVYKELTSIQHRVDKETEILLDAKMGGVIYQPDHHLSVSQILQDANYALAKCKNEPNLPYFFMEKSHRII